MVVPLVAAAMLWQGAAAGPTTAFDSGITRAESLLAAGDLAAARRQAERLLDARPEDVRLLVLLGRVHLARPVVGRFAAESLLRRAAALAPDDPAPHYWLGHVGLDLGGDDGEMTARWGLVRVLAIDPDYRDAWALWLRLYRADRERRAALAALDRFAGRYAADLRRAQLLVELRRYGEAEPLLRSLMRERGDDPAPRALLTRALFEQSRDLEGAAEWEEALLLADRDSAGVLWQMLRSIATPAERDAYLETPPRARAAFLRLFWSRREPDIGTALNERVGEHFRRLAEARRGFGLLHPNARWHRSATFRSLAGASLSFGNADLAAITARARAEQCSARLPESAADTRFLAGLTPRLDTVSAEASPNLEDGLDDRGRVWVRHGRPDVRATYGLDGETWCYLRHDGVLRVTFARRTGFGGVSGDVVFTPVQAGEAESAALLMATDAPGDRPSLAFVFWPAAFRADDGRFTELLLFPDSVGATGVLIGADGREAARDSGTNRSLLLRADPGPYLLLVDAARAGARGRYRGATVLPDYGDGGLAVSGVLLASGRVAAERDTLAAAAPPGLVLPASEPMRVYAEVYGLDTRDGFVRYEARYRFERSDGGFLNRSRRERVSVVSFTRERAVTRRVVESLVVDPGRLPPGRYRLVLEIVDRLRGAATASATMEFRLR